MRKALTVSKNLIAMPRIPRSKSVKDNPDQKFEESGSCWQYGRNRLTETILRWELWDTARQTRGYTVSGAGKEFEDQWKREHLAGAGALRKGRRRRRTVRLSRNWKPWKSGFQKSASEAAAKAETDARDKQQERRRDQQGDGRCHAAAHEKDRETAISPHRTAAARSSCQPARMEEAKKLAPQLKDVNEHRLALIHHALGDTGQGHRNGEGLC